MSVLIAVAVTSLGVYGAVSVGGAFFPGSATIASASAQVQVCPVTGCTATGCHGATGEPPPSGGGHRRSASSWNGG